LRSEKWETRIAAGQAIAAIVGQVPAWDPTYDPSKASEEVSTNTGNLRFDTIDFGAVLESGTVLLASGGTEFEEDPADLDPDTLLARQKAQLEQRMGVNSHFMSFGDMVDPQDYQPHVTDAKVYVSLIPTALDSRTSSPAT
jgi:TATA-binding protein-associated factor